MATAVRRGFELYECLLVNTAVSVNDAYCDRVNCLQSLSR